MAFDDLSFRTTGAAPPFQRIGLWLVWLMLIAAIVSLSLYPFSGWKASADLPWTFLSKPLPKYWTGFDFWTNLLAYLPLGWVTLRLFAPYHPLHFGLLKGPLVLAILGALLFGAGLSSLMEAVQTYLPLRRAQWLDLLANCLGICLGMLMDLVGRIRNRSLRGGSAQDPTGALYTQVPANHLWLPVSLTVLWCLAQAAPMNLWPGLGDLLPANWAIRPFAWASGADQVFGLSAAERILTEAFMVVAALTSWSFILFQVKQILGQHWPRLRNIGWPSILVFGMVSACLIRIVWMSLLVPAVQYPNGLLQAIEVWLTAGVQTGLVVTALLGAAMAGLSARAQLSLVIILLALLVGVSSGQPESGYDNFIAQTWSQGRWLNLRGLASWSAALWPAFALAWLVTGRTSWTGGLK
jgi:VanZ family protein